MKRLVGVFLCCAPLQAAEEEAVKRVYAHLLIQDAAAAVGEAKLSLTTFPQSKALQAALIRALCEKGEEVEAIAEWELAASPDIQDPNSRRLIETVAWGVLLKGDQSSQMLIRFCSLLGASLTRDARALPMLLKAVKGSNAHLRSLAAGLCTRFGDAPLQDELLRLLKEEKIWHVRLEAIKAIGQMRMTQASEILKEIVGNPKTLAEEKAAAIIALVNMYESVEEKELQGFVNSPRAGLRQLACEIVQHLELEEGVKLILPLLKDTSQDVRMSAINALVLSGVASCKGRSMKEWIAPCLEDLAPEVAITAAWGMVLAGDERGGESLKKWLDSSNSEIRRLASGAVAVSGSQGIDIAWKTMQTHPDPYVCATLALGLIGQRAHEGAACEKLYAVLIKEADVLWMWDDHINPLFRCLNESRVFHIEQVPNYPIVIDQMTRLNILSVLSVMKYPKAFDAVKGFLQHRSWGVSGAAAAALLQEGDAEALPVVRELLADPEEKVRVQAALILALFGRERAAVSVLQEAYPRLEREMQLYILEALGSIGDPSSIPFLMDVLKEPFQMLRVVAASALIQCLYH